MDFYKIIYFCMYVCIHVGMINGSNKCGNVVLFEAYSSNRGLLDPPSFLP